MRLLFLLFFIGCETTPVDQKEWSPEASDILDKLKGPDYNGELTNVTLLSNEEN